MKLPPQERRQTVITAGRCLNCLSTGHLAVTALFGASAESVVLISELSTLVLFMIAMNLRPLGPLARPRPLLAVLLHHLSLAHPLIT